MPCFSVPADFQTSTIERLSQKNKQWEIPVKEVYGSLNPSIFGSGRKTSDIQSINFEKLRQYVQFCRENGIEFNYTLNFTCNSNMEFTRKGREEIIKFARKLNSIGVQRFTAVLPSVIEILNEFVPEAKITVSVLSNVDSPFRLKTFLSARNVDRIMVPEFLNRQTSLLKQLTSYKEKCGYEIGTIVNSTCLSDCPFRDFHYSSVSHCFGGKNYKDNLLTDYYSARCHSIRFENPEEWLKSPWIRPENLKDYVGLGIDWFKISGREEKNADFVKVVDIYNKGSFEGNLLEFLMCFSDSTFKQVFIMENKNLDKFARRFLEDNFYCKIKDCEVCHYCKSNSNLVSANTLNPWYNWWKELFQKECSAIIKHKL